MSAAVTNGMAMTAFTTIFKVFYMLHGSEIVSHTCWLCAWCYKASACQKIKLTFEAVLLGLVPCSAKPMTNVRKIKNESAAHDRRYLACTCSHREQNFWSWGTGDANWCLKFVRKRGATVVFSWSYKKLVNRTSWMMSVRHVTRFVNMPGLHVHQQSHVCAWLSLGLEDLLLWKRTVLKFFKFFCCVHCCERLLECLCERKAKVMPHS